MNNLQLIKSSKFGEVECDIYSNEKEKIKKIINSQSNTKINKKGGQTI